MSAPTIHLIDSRLATPCTVFKCGAMCGKWVGRRVATLAVRDVTCEPCKAAAGLVDPPAVEETLP